jgi:excisionase family DNA binding protein
MHQRTRYLSPAAFRNALDEISGLSLSSPKIYEMLENRKIRALKVGTHWRIDANEIINLPERLLSEGRGLPVDHLGLLGNAPA